jgi:hypothetical protein
MPLFAKAAELSAPIVLFWRHGLKVIRVHTPGRSTQMIYLKSFRNYAAILLVHVPSYVLPLDPSMARVPFRVQRT